MNAMKSVSLSKAFCYDKHVNKPYSEYLPSGYYFVDKIDISPEEIISL